MDQDFIHGDPLFLQVMTGLAASEVSSSEMMMMTPLLELLNSRLQENWLLQQPHQEFEQKPQMSAGFGSPPPQNPQMNAGFGPPQPPPQRMREEVTRLKKAPRPTGHETTLMIRNIPNRTKSTRLLEKMDEAGFAGTYDYVYLPLDPQSWVNKGYAFVNFTTPAAARAFASVVEGIPMESGTRSKKHMCASPAKLQGVLANLQAISNGYSAEEACWPWVRIAGVLEEIQPASAVQLLKTSWPA